MGRWWGVSSIEYSFLSSCPGSPSICVEGWLHSVWPLLIVDKISFYLLLFFLVKFWDSIWWTLHSLDLLLLNVSSEWNIRVCGLPSWLASLSAPRNSKRPPILSSDSVLHSLLWLSQPYSVVQLCSICLFTYRLMARQTELPFVAKHLQRCVDIVLVRLGQQKAVPVGERCAGLKQMPIAMPYSALLMCTLGSLPCSDDSFLCFLALAIHRIMVCALGAFAERSVAPTWNIRGISMGRADSCPQL